MLRTRLECVEQKKAVKECCCAVLVWRLADAPVTDLIGVANGGPGWFLTKLLRLVFFIQFSSTGKCYFIFIPPKNKNNGIFFDRSALHGEYEMSMMGFELWTSNFGAAILS